MGQGVPKIICTHKSVIIGRANERTIAGTKWHLIYCPCGWMMVHSSLQLSGSFSNTTIHLSKVNVVVVGLILKPKPISITSGSPGQPNY